MKKGTSITLALVLMCSLFMGINLNVSAEASYNTGYEAPEVEYIELTEEEYEDIVAQEQGEVTEVQPDFTLRSFSLKKSTNNYWKQFSKPYYSYEFGGIIMSDEKKAVYDRAYSTLYGMIDGGNDCVNDGGYTYTPFVDCGNLSDQDIQDIVSVIQSNHPELYFISSRYQLGTVSSSAGVSKKIRFEVYEDFATGTSRTEASNRIMEKISWYVSNVDLNGSAYDIEKKIHDLLCNNVTYDLNAPYNQSCASVFLNENGESVCAGYSEAFCLLCNMCGIPTVSITSSSHEWNYVYLGNFWYGVDVTWADQKSYIYYGFFNKSDKTFMTGDSHVVTNHTPTNVWTNVGRANSLYDYGQEPDDSYCDENGHIWGSVTYTWNSDNTKCTAKRVCQNVSTHIEEETVDTTSIKTPSTCTSSGTTKYTATFSNSAFVTQTKTVTDEPATGHNWNAPTYTWSADGKTCTATRVCKNDPNHKEIEIATVANKKVTAKTLQKYVKCKTNGIVQYTATFKNAAFKQQTKKVTIPAHTYGKVTYTWSADGKTCTATRVCTSNKNHKQTETVKATATVAKKATATAMGQTRYTATFKNSAFKQQAVTKTDIKIAQPMTVVAKTTSKKPVVVKFTALKSKNQVVAAKNAYAVSKAQGKVTCKKLSGNASFTVASNGNIFVKKGTAKGIYGIKVRVTAAGGAKYKAGYKDVVVYVLVK